MHLYYNRSHQNTVFKDRKGLDDYEMFTPLIDDVEIGDKLLLVLHSYTTYDSCYSSEDVHIEVLDSYRLDELETANALALTMVRNIDSNHEQFKMFNRLGVEFWPYTTGWGYDHHIVWVAKVTVAGTVRDPDHDGLFCWHDGDKIPDMH